MACQVLGAALALFNKGYVKPGSKEGMYRGLPSNFFPTLELKQYPFRMLTTVNRPQSIGPRNGIGDPDVLRRGLYSALIWSPSDADTRRETASPDSLGLESSIEGVWGGRGPCPFAV